LAGAAEHGDRAGADGLRLRACILLFSPACDTVLLVASSSRAGAWVVPGGGIEPGETPSACALRELWEEAGAVPCGACAPLSAAPLQCKRSVTTPFACRLGRLEEAYPESGARERRWVPLLEVPAALAGSAVGAAVWAAAMEALCPPGAAPSAAAILAKLSAEQ
jgi:8-oxo-dGTP pyrophosphatase MutT (NUDIX family)